MILRIPQPLTEEELRNLLDNIDVNASSASFGIDIYARVLDFVARSQA